VRRPWWQWVIIAGLVVVLFWLLFLAPRDSVPWWAFLMWSAAWFTLFAVTGPNTLWEWIVLSLGCALITFGALLDFPGWLLWVYGALLAAVALIEWLNKRRARADVVSQETPHH
jgi:hypothetical protein